MVTHVISEALFPDMQSEVANCPNCSAPISAPVDRSVWVIDHPHPLVPELKIERAFVDDGGIEFYSFASDGKTFARHFIPTIRYLFAREAMPLEMFVEELASTVVPGLPVITRMITKAFFKARQSKTMNCPNPRCKMPISVSVPTDEIGEEPVVWMVGQAHPLPLSGMDLKVMRIVFVSGEIHIYSVSVDGNNGVRDRVPMNQLGLSEEGMGAEMFCTELEDAENDDEEDDEVDDPSLDPGTQTAPVHDPIPDSDHVTATPATAPATNGQQIQQPS
jgi:hypothetical protein